MPNPFDELKTKWVMDSERQQRVIPALEVLKAFGGDRTVLSNVNRYLKLVSPNNRFQPDPTAKGIYSKWYLTEAGVFELLCSNSALLNVKPDDPTQTRQIKEALNDIKQQILAIHLPTLLTGDGTLKLPGVLEVETVEAKKLPLEAKSDFSSVEESEAHKTLLAQLEAEKNRNRELQTALDAAKSGQEPALAQSPLATDQEKDNRILELESVVTELNSQVADLEAKVNSKPDKELEQLKAAKVSLEKQYAQLRVSKGIDPAELDKRLDAATNMGITIGKEVMYKEFQKRLTQLQTEQKQALSQAKLDGIKKLSEFKERLATDPKALLDFVSDLPVEARLELQQELSRLENPDGLETELEAIEETKETIMFGNFS